MQEGRVEAAGEDVSLADQQEVGRAGLLHRAARAEQHLVHLVLVACLERRAHGRGVVSAGLDHAEVIGRAVLLILDVDAQRLHAAREVIPHRAREHDQRRLVRGRGGRADIGHGPVEHRPQVQRARRLRHLRADAVDDRQHHGRKLLRVGLGQHEQARALAHPLDVLVHAKHMDAAVGPAIGLEALEALARIVQHVRGGMDLDRPGRADLVLAPLAVAIRGDGHLVGQHCAEGGTDLSVSAHARGVLMFAVGFEGVRQFSLP